MRHLHLPIWLASPTLPHPITFAALSFLMVLMRAVVMTVIPLKAYALLGDAGRVSVLYFLVSLVSLCGAMAIPWLVNVLSRRWTFTLAVGFGATGLGLMAQADLVLFAAGMLCQVVAIACMEVILNLYVMDHIPRRKLIGYEPMRMGFAALAFSVGPWLGVRLQSMATPETPFLLAMAMGGAALAYFWVLRLRQHPAIAPMRAPAPNPLRYLPRFFRQPRLVLAYLIACSRSAWWIMLFVYGPIYCVETGLGAEAGGALVSLASLFVFLAPFWGRVAARHGMRRLLIPGYLGCGLVTLLAAGLAGWPWLGFATLLLAAGFGGVLDGVGNVPFMRAVRPLQRAEMTTVFVTYRDVSQIGPPALFSVLLRFFPLQAVFAAAGLMMLLMAYESRHVPKRM